MYRLIGDCHDLLAIAMKGQALYANPLVLEWEKAQRWDGALPRVTGSYVPFMDVDDGK